MDYTARGARGNYSIAGHDGKRVWNLRESRVPQKCIFKDICRCRTKRGIDERGRVNPSFGMIWTLMVVRVTPQEGLPWPHPPIRLLEGQRQR